jgi:hypothetical protein
MKKNKNGNPKNSATLICCCSRLLLELVSSTAVAEDSAALCCRWMLQLGHGAMEEDSSCYC